MYYIYVIIINTYIEHVEMQVYSFLSFFSQAVCDWLLTEYECMMCEKL